MKLTHTDLKPENILFVCSDYEIVPSSQIIKRKKVWLNHGKFSNNNNNNNNNNINNVIINNVNNNNNNNNIIINILFVCTDIII